MSYMQNTKPFQPNTTYSKWNVFHTLEKKFSEFCSKVPPPPLHIADLHLAQHTAEQVSSDLNGRRPTRRGLAFEVDIE